MEECLCVGMMDNCLNWFIKQLMGFINAYVDGLREKLEN
jgi:hypothetical protein